MKDGFEIFLQNVSNIIRVLFVAWNLLLILAAQVIPLLTEGRMEIIKIRLINDSLINKAV